MEDALSLKKPPELRDRLIDGWRGASILLVVVGHLVGSRYKDCFQPTSFRSMLSADQIDIALLLKNIVLRTLSAGSDLGVNLFFVISGYLITRFLLEEQHRNGAVNIPAFYVRRAFRILPALYVFLACVAVLAGWRLLPVGDAEIASAAMFLCNTKWGACTWWLGHTWTLSVEWQYYIAWPVFLAFVPRRNLAASIIVLLIALSPLSALDLLTVRWQNSALSFSCIAIGALYACAPSASRLCKHLASGILITICTVVLLCKPFTIFVPFGYQVHSLATPLMVALIMFGTLHGRGPWKAVIANEWMRRLGLVSYGLYLWQQIFMAHPVLGAHAALTMPALALPCALFSYAIIERPMIKVGRRLANRLSNGTLSTLSAIDSVKSAAASSDSRGHQ